MPGFVKTNKEVKLLVLFALAQINEPPTFEEITQATLVDDGVNYFLLKQSVDQLLLPENIIKDGECYVLTKRGRQNVETCYEEIPMTVRKKCTEAVKNVNLAQKKRRNVKSDFVEQEDGTAMVHLKLLGDNGVLFQMEMLIPEIEQAQKICESFQKNSTTYFFALRDVAEKLTIPPEGFGDTAT